LVSLILVYIKVEVEFTRFGESFDAHMDPEPTLKEPLPYYFQFWPAAVVAEEGFPCSTLWVSLAQAIAAIARVQKTEMENAHVEIPISNQLFLIIQTFAILRDPYE